jgi:hypothetical protein
MSSEGVDCAIQVRRQVWESLVSMLRVYAHAASLNDVAEYVVTSSSEDATVQHLESTLGVRLDPTTGEGHWRITRPECEVWGKFRIEEDGNLVFPVGPKPLDQASIDWLEQLGHAELHRPVTTTP